MPTIVFLFVYLSQLLRIGEEEAARDVVDDLLAGEREHEPVLVPRGAAVSDDAWRVSTPASVGDDCRLHGNVRAESLAVGADTEIFGSLRARGDVSIGRDTVIHGDVTTRGGRVSVAEGAHVRGDVSCEDLRLHVDAVVDGAIRARGEVDLDRERAPADVPDAEAATGAAGTADGTGDADGADERGGADGTGDADDAAADDGTDGDPEEYVPAVVRVDYEPAIVRVEEPSSVDGPSPGEESPPGDDRSGRGDVDDSADGGPPEEPAVELVEEAEPGDLEGALAEAERR